jgi:hypothetical protein
MPPIPPYMLEPYPPYPIPPIPPIREYGEEYELIPPYGEPIPPVAPYGEYALALRFTAEASVEGRSGIAGAADDVVEVIDGVAIDAPVVDAVDADSAIRSHQRSEPHKSTCCGISQNQPELAPAIPPLSHGFGGDTLAILTILQIHYLASPLSLFAELIVEVVADGVKDCCRDVRKMRSLEVVISCKRRDPIAPPVSCGVNKESTFQKSGVVGGCGFGEFEVTVMRMYSSLG